MKKKEDIERQVSETLKVLDRIEKTGPDPFFYTRLKARLESETIESGSWSYKIKYALYATLVLLIINGFSIVKALEWREDYTEEASVNNFIENYHLDVDELNLLTEHEIQPY